MVGYDIILVMVTCRWDIGLNVSWLWGLGGICMLIVIIICFLIVLVLLTGIG